MSFEAITLLLAIVAIGTMIVIHEWGHFFVARKSGMRVERFSVGFGPTLIEKQVGETIYQVAAVPLGGYVKIAGMDPSEELPPDDQGSYETKPTWKRAAVVAAGPITNYAFALILALTVFTVWGKPFPTTTIWRSVKGSPAAGAGLTQGDEVVSINGQAVANVLEVQKLLASMPAEQLKDVKVQYRRAGELKEVTLTPKDRKLGISFSAVYRSMPIGEALTAGVTYPFVLSKEILAGLGRIFQGRQKAEFMGPIGIGKEMMGQIAQGFPQALMFLALLNVYLGLFNLLPVPALDGGRLVFLGVEAVARRKVRPSLEQMVHTVGFFLLLAMLVLVSIKDVRRLF
jgi:regulator of sigma E protease